MTVRVTSAALLVMLLSGCASTGTMWVFDKAGATDAQVKRDRAECFAESIDTEDSNRAGVGFKLNREAYRACMEGRGYRVRVATIADGPTVWR
jgi:hypothetical protein